MSAAAPELESAARAALAEVTSPETVGELLGTAEPAEGVIDLAFDSRLPGYVGWRWTVSVAQLPDEPASVLEVELLPGADALVAPAWVPWAERLAEYRRTHPDEPIDEAAEDDLEDDDLDADEDALEEADDELDGVEFETSADEDDEPDEETDDDLDGVEFETPADEDDEPDEETDDDLEDEDEDDAPDDALHGPGDERLRGD